ncbi:MAG: hypothetical protein OXQ90_07225 [Gammaproteobacteria bacterium]|nr:hypothetical protein [Gammaproteobacteria bacterium]
MAVAFGGDGDFLGSRTARRLYAGQPTTDAHRRRLFAAVAGLLVDAGVVETSDVLRRGDVARALGQAPLRWDRILGRLESRAGPVGGAVAERALRLAAVDLAIRRCYGCRRSPSASAQVVRDFTPPARGGPRHGMRGWSSLASNDPGSPARGRVETVLTGTLTN